MIHGGIPKTRISPRSRDSKKGLLLSMTLVLFIIGALAIMMFTGGEEENTDDLLNASINANNTDSDNESMNSSLGDTENIGVNEVESQDETESSEASDEPEFFIHILKKNENFSVLAKKYYNDMRKYYIIAKANPDVKPNRMQIGQKIKVPNINRKPSESAPESNADSSSGNNTPKKDTGFTSWKKFDSDDKKESKGGNNFPRHPFGLQEQPEVPDDENVGTLKKVVIREKTIHYASQGDSPVGLSMKFYGRFDLKSLIEKANPFIDWYNLKGGERIIIPEFSEMRVVSPKPEKDFSNKRDETTGEPVTNVAEEKKETTEYEIYVVKAGDSLWSIAAKKLGSGTKFKEIMELNGLTNEDVSEGMKLKLPKR